MSASKNSSSPGVNESLGTEVSVERIGFSLVRTFPDIGLVLEQFTLDTPGGGPFPAL